MVVVVGRIVVYGVPYGSVHLSLYVGEELLVCLECPLLVVVEPVEAYVLQRPAALGSGKGVGDSRLRGYLSPLCGDEAL